MKKLWLGVWLVMLSVGVVYGGDANGKRILIRTAGDVDAKWIERVVPFASENTGLDIQVGEAVAGDFTLLNDVAAAAAQQLGPEDAFAVVLAGIKTEEPAHGICLPDQRVAVINVHALLSDGPDEERAGRRLDRQVMQSIGLLAGLSACPNPQCVLYPYRDMEELDAKGRNLCPPCFDQLQRKAQEQGLRMRMPEPRPEEEISQASEAPTVSVETAAPISVAE